MLMSQAEIKNSALLLIVATVADDNLSNGCPVHGVVSQSSEPSAARSATVFSNTARSNASPDSDIDITRALRLP